MKLPTLPKMPMADYERMSMKIGDYYLWHATDGQFWIEHESGEGMHVSRKTMEKLIRDFYLENF